MSFALISSLSTWHLVASIVLTIIAVILGFLYTYLRYKKDEVSVSATDTSNGLVRGDQVDDKWPIPAAQETVESRDKLPSDDPVEYCSHIQRQVKKTQHRIARQKIESTMTNEQRDAERETQRRQLEEIFRLMEEQKEKFGIRDQNDVREQLKLYV